MAEAAYPSTTSTTSLWGGFLSLILLLTPGTFLIARRSLRELNPSREVTARILGLHFIVRERQVHYVYPVPHPPVPSQITGLGVTTRFTWPVMAATPITTVSWCSGLSRLDRPCSI